MPSFRGGAGEIFTIRKALTSLVCALVVSSAWGLYVVLLALEVLCGGVEYEEVQRCYGVVVCMRRCHGVMVCMRRCYGVMVWYGDGVVLLCVVGCCWVLQ